MSPLPRLHHHDIMAIVGLFFIRIVYNLSCNVGALKVTNLHYSRQQCVVAEWSRRSITVRVRVRVRARAREWDFSLLFFFFFVLKNFVVAQSNMKNNSTIVIMS